MRLSNLGMFAGTFAGLLVVGNLVPLVRSAGYSQSDALVSVMLFSIGNSVARILWGHLYDTVCIRSIPVSLAAVALFFPLNRILLQVVVFLVGFLRKKTSLHQKAQKHPTERLICSFRQTAGVCLVFKFTKR